MESKDCTICASPYTSYMRKRIKCEYCDFEACKECSSTYLLNVAKPKCMNTICTGEWSREFISDNLTKVFANTKLKKHKSEMLFQEQQSWMMESQLEIEEEMRKAKICRKIRILQKKQTDLRRDAHARPESRALSALQDKRHLEERNVNAILQERYTTLAKIRNNQQKLQSLKTNDQTKQKINADKIEENTIMIERINVKIKELIQTKDKMLDELHELQTKNHWNIEQLINPENDQLNE